MTAQERDEPLGSPDDDLDDLPLGDLVRLTHAAARSLSRRLSSARPLDELAPVPQQQARPADWGSMLPVDRLVDGATGEPGEGADAGVVLDQQHSFKPFVVPSGGAGGEVGDEPASASARPAHGFAAPALTLPVLHQLLEVVARSVTAAQMSLAGHTEQVFELPADRARLLGLPAGKTAFRDTADYLRGLLRVDRSEARRRLRHAAALGTSRTVTGQDLPPRFPELAEAVQAGLLDRASIDHLDNTLAQARKMADRAGVDPGVADRMIRAGEELLVDQGQVLDPRTLKKVCHRWLQRFEAAVDPDGAEPVDLDSPREQGLVHKGKRNGFHQWLLSANDAQHEILMTIASAATNPRARHKNTDPRQAEPGAEPGAETGAGPDGAEPVAEARDSGTELWQVELGAETQDGGTEPATDPRTQSQKRLDGLIACLAGGLAAAESNTLPWTGGARPQVAVTIDYQTLLGELADAGTITAEDLARFHTDAAFTETVHPQTIRTLACDADILPVVLGSEGQILDVGRAQRLFPARLRQAIAARDGGCAAPGCGIPAPWCDVHHVQYWERGGPTSTDNGVLLCNHHHHSVHAGAWDIDIGSGRPWFIPAPYLDPQQRPQRNRYWRH